MTAHPEITDGDLRTRPGEILAAVERGESFILIRDGRPIGKLVPLRPGQRLVSRQEFAAQSRGAPALDPEVFRADQDAALDQDSGRPRGPG
jgi:antitoxin (DNA-binding transcriptional repressor) of toxin-antitoxin stability system